jgi:hypothetical protein
MRRAELSTAEREAIASRRAFIHAHMPELLPEIKLLHELGMIDGWRNVTHAGHEAPPVRGVVFSGPFLPGNYFVKGK